MSNYVEYEDTIGFVPWMERNLLSKFRGSNLKFFAVVGIMLLAGFCLIGIGVEADGLYGKILDAYTKYNFLFLYIHHYYLKLELIHIHLVLYRYNLQLLM